MPIFHRKPILVPTDYSEASLQAVRVAKSIAETDSDVTVVHAAMDVDLTLHPLTWISGLIANYSEERLLLILRNWCKEQNLGASIWRFAKEIQEQKSARLLIKWAAS